MLAERLRALKPSSATLIVVPPPMLPHWRNQLTLHAQPGAYMRLYACARVHSSAWIAPWLFDEYRSDYVTDFRGKIHTVPNRNMTSNSINVFRHSGPINNLKFLQIPPLLNEKTCRRCIASHCCPPDSRTRRHAWPRARPSHPSARRAHHRQSARPLPAPAASRPKFTSATRIKIHTARNVAAELAKETFNSVASWTFVSHT